MRKFTTTIFLLIFNCLLFSSVSSAEPLEILLEHSSRDLMTEIHKGRDDFDDNAEVLFEKVDSALAELVDYPVIVRGIMGVYYKNATEQQRAVFQGIFRKSIIELLTKTLILIEGESIRVLPVDGQVGKRASVKMDVITKSGKNYSLIYSMARENELWRVQNMIVDGINLGLIYRNQFKSAMQEEHEDFDVVSNNWRTTSQ